MTPISFGANFADLPCRPHCSVPRVSSPAPGSPRGPRTSSFALIPGRLRAQERLPIVGVVFRPKDRWSTMDDATAIVAAREAIFTYGLAWLETHTPGKAISSWR